MLSANLRNIPVYLRDSSLFESFHESDEECFEIPENCFKQNTSVHDNDDLIHILSTIRYWGVHHLPEEVYKFIIEASDDDAEAIQRSLSMIPEYTEYLHMLLKLREIPQYKRICHAVAQPCCDVDVLQYLVASGCKVWEDAERDAVRANNLTCLKWMHSLPDNAKSYHWNVTNLCYYAALDGHLEMLKYLHVRGSRWNRQVCAAAAQTGQLYCLQYAHENGCDWDGQVLRVAAMYGHLDCLKYVYEHGCTDWNHVSADTSAQISGEGHLNCLKYAHEHGCRWHWGTVDRAISRHQWSCAIYAIRNGADYSSELKFLLDILGDDTLTIFMCTSGNLTVLRVMMVLLRHLLLMFVPQFQNYFEQKVS